MAGYLRDLFLALRTDELAAAALRVAAVFLCLTVHETCHGLAALALGDPTAKNQRRISLNPLRHIDWFGLAMMFFAGFGWARPVPVDARYFKNPKWGMALTALAGPASNFVLAFLAMLGACGILVAASFSGASVLMDFLIRTAILSIGLGLFNLLPFPPLDGSKVVAALLPDRIYVRWMRYERYGIVILLAVSLLGWNAGFIGRAVELVYRAMGNAAFDIITLFA